MAGVVSGVFEVDFTAFGGGFAEGESGAGGRVDFIFVVGFENFDVEIFIERRCAALDEGKALMKRGTVDLSMLDAKVEELCAKILLTFPDCTTKTLEELRKPKLEAWNRNKEDSRAWLALNMMTEARSGFIAFNEGSKDDREVDFVLLRQKLAAGESWVGPLHDSIQPHGKRGV